MVVLKKWFHCKKGVLFPKTFLEKGWYFTCLNTHVYPLFLWDVSHLPDPTLTPPFPQPQIKVSTQYMVVHYLHIAMFTNIYHFILPKEHDGIIVNMIHDLIKHNFAIMVQWIAIMQTMRPRYSWDTANSQDLKYNTHQGEVAKR